MDDPLLPALQRSQSPSIKESSPEVIAGVLLRIFSGGKVPYMTFEFLLQLKGRDGSYVRQFGVPGFLVSALTGLGIRARMFRA